ncbi:MAG TPA: hypothetical protein VMZ91_03605 [Candidatus Paceibacterota bacterium]|nr:hypothetical protein [Candidatus Paceibacterota bacterium]
MTEEQKRTSLELSKWLQENSCEIENENVWADVDVIDKKEKRLTTRSIMAFCGQTDIIANAYDILNEICIKYVKEFWGDSKWKKEHRHMVFDLLQQGKKQEAEKYIMEHSLFNPKNK